MESLLYESPAETRLTVYRWLDIVFEEVRFEKRSRESIIVVEKILKFIEMVLTCEHEFEFSEFYPSRIF